MANNGNGGDGSAVAVTGEPPAQTPPQLEGEVSATPEELEAKIDEELGLPSTPKKADEPVEEPTEPEAPVEEEPETPSEEEPAEETKPTPDKEPVKEPEKTVAKPTDDDLYIEVEDGEGVTHKISSIEDIPDDFQYKNARQPLELLDKLQNLKAERQARADLQAEEERTASEKQAQTEQYDAWDKEIAELGKAKRLDVKDTETIDKVFGYMNEINDARIKAGNPNLVTSFEDAFDKYEAKAAKDDAASKAKEDTERAKIKAGLIGGSGAPSAGANSPYVSGRYKNIDDVPL